MMKRHGRSNLTDTGVALLLIGVGVKVAVVLAHLANPLANLAILAGVVLVVTGVVLPNRR